MINKKCATERQSQRPFYDVPIDFKSFWEGVKKPWQCSLHVQGQINPEMDSIFPLFWMFGCSLGINMKYISLDLRLLDENIFWWRKIAMRRFIFASSTLFPAIHWAKLQFRKLLLKYYFCIASNVMYRLGKHCATLYQAVMFGSALWTGGSSSRVLYLSLLCFTLLHSRRLLSEQCSVLYLSLLWCASLGVATLGGWPLQQPFPGSRQIK